MLEISENHEEQLSRIGTWPEAVHVFDENSIWAVNAALAAQRPLLVRGEPGCGKSQLARAAAHVLGRAFIPAIVHARSESQDLQYSFDAVRRLGKAQALGATGKAIDVDNELAEGLFVSPGPLWWTLNWQTASEQAIKCVSAAGPPEAPTGWEPQQGTVLLIDEIDKADADLPNGLLETLGNGAFSIPMLGVSVTIPDGCPPPLVVITTNEERELPTAFVRRCLVLHLGLPKDKDELTQHLCSRGMAHFSNKCTEEIYNKAAKQLIKDRNEAHDKGLAAPGLAEYLDMIRALVALQKKGHDPSETLDKIACFVLQKHPPEIS